MHLDLELNSQASARLTEAAKQRGIDFTTLLEDLLTEHLPPAEARVGPRVSEKQWIKACLVAGHDTLCVNIE